jgi:CRP/FNR family transcriptional regulator|tara:strand:- start:1086 stop:1829 length:744 start_codon:yes stop_codon:yes gene_type:complete
MTGVDKLPLAGTITLSCKDCSLAELCLPRGLSPKEFEQFVSMVKQRSPLATRDVLYRSGDAFRAIYAVKSGCIKTSIASADGGEQITGFFMPGELFGFDGLDNGHVCTAAALERSRVCELPVTSVDELAQQIPGLRRELFRMMSREINEEQSMLFLLAQRSADDRLAAFLLSLSTRMQYHGRSGVEFRLSMSRHDIANYLGLAAETVSRHLGRLTEEKVISISGRTVVIEDPANLRTRVEQCIGGAR